jgi:hypothetical protein
MMWGVVLDRFHSCFNRYEIAIRHVAYAITHRRLMELKSSLSSHCIAYTHNYLLTLTGHQYVALPPMTVRRDPATEEKGAPLSLELVDTPARWSFPR